jgi:hypothetical protein
MNYIAIAAEALNMQQEEIQKYQKYISEYEAYYFWQPIRGGSAVIVGKDGGRLIAGSAVRFEDHLKEYLHGRRN